MVIGGSAATDQSIGTHQLLLLSCSQGHVQWWCPGSEMASVVLHQGIVLSSHSYKAVVLPTITSLRCSSSCQSACCSCRRNTTIDAGKSRWRDSSSLTHSHSVVSQVLLCYWLICSITVFKLKWLQLLSYWVKGRGTPETLKYLSWLSLHFFKSSRSQSFCSIEFFINTLLITACLCCPSPPQDTLWGTARFLYTPEHHWSKVALGLRSDSWGKYFIKLLSQILCPDS